MWGRFGSLVLASTSVLAYVACADDSAPPPVRSSLPEGSVGGSGGTGAENTGGTSLGGSSGARSDASIDSGSGGRGTIRDASLDLGPGNQDTGTTTSAVDGSCAVAGTWPPSAPAADARCTPTCALPSCATECPIAADGRSNTPCDTGCCGSNKLTFFGSCWSPNGHLGPMWNVVAVSPDDVTYSACECRYVDPNPTCITDPPVCTVKGGDQPVNFCVFREGALRDGGLGIDQGPVDLSATMTDAGINFGEALRVLLAFGTIGGKEAVYAAYQVGMGPDVSFGIEHGRFGVTTGGRWTFEDLPAVPVALAADRSGAALVLTVDHVLHRNAAGGWDAVCLPDVADAGAGGGEALAVDGEGAWYVLRHGTDGLRISRRDPNGSWATEMVPGIAAALAVGAGTVHLAYLTGPGQNLGYGDVYYARRVGTSWQSTLITLEKDLPADVSGDPVGSYSVAVAVDSCGAPHIALYGLTTFYKSNVYYYRWTAGHWYWSHVYSGGYGLTPDISLALTSSSAEFAFYDDRDGWVDIAIPFR